VTDYILNPKVNYKLLLIIDIASQIIMNRNNNQGKLNQKSHNF